ncbi:GMC family oxidoreductase [Rhodovulum sulfidophilum]|uniref:GMC oxidoreductase n=1 Tax=Rhodovulum sulfidophilum TaxID=35806 RepID=UPI001924FF6C|nr:GMC family oxidoreductase [Rhodovulum sulfidophilum]MBL3593980.1 GMC family oxidoreductase [Rhodovulum sulfidophilum]
MIEQIDLETAAATEWDVVVAGSSFAAMFFILGLPSDLSVLVVEKGAIFTWDQQVREGQRPREEIRIRNGSNQPKEFIAHTLFGGNSNCWWGQTPRFHPNDFRLRSRYGVSEDWPLSYDELVTFYDEVEQVMEIAGGGTGHITPRSAPYPFPAHIPSRSDRVLLKNNPRQWVPVPTARANGGLRAQCCANGICSHCPIEAKFTVMNSLERFARPRLRLLAGAECRAVEVEAGRARSMIVRSGRTEKRLGGSAIALATNGIFNPAILMRSGLGSDATGRYLHEQVSVMMTLDINSPNWFGGSSITLHGYHAYDGAHRKTDAAVLFENYNAPNSLRHERGRWTERMLLKLIAEDLPQSENRVRLDKTDEPVIEWVGHSDYAERGLDRARTMLPDLLPFTVERVARTFRPATEAHIMGTHRMGRDPTNSVTDPDMKLHGTENLLVLGSGAFPSCSPANPTLTLSALSLRAGRRLV